MVLPLGVEALFKKICKPLGLTQEVWVGGKMVYDCARSRVRFPAIVTQKKKKVRVSALPFP